MAVNRALNPASESWGREVERKNAANEQALIRSTLNLQNTDRALQDAITRLNQALEAARRQQDYLLSLAVFSSATQTSLKSLPAGAWSNDEDLRPFVTLRAPTGLIRIIISAYGHNAVVTYAIPQVVTRESATTSYVQQSAQLVLPGGTASMTSQREWVQAVPRDQDITVRVECKGVGESSSVASPAIIVQVLPLASA